MARALLSMPQGRNNPPLDFPPEFWEQVEGFRERLLRQAQAILGNSNDAEEVVQDTFCEVFNERAKLAQVESIGAWLGAINRRLALNRRRDRKRYSVKVSQKNKVSPAREVTTGGFSGIDLRDVVNKGLETLPPSLRAVIILRYFQDLSYDQIAEKLQVPRGTVSYLLCQASAQLYRKLACDQQSPPSTVENPAPDSGAQA